MTTEGTTAPFNPDSLSLFPASPGVYVMKDAEGTIIYIGKAANLKSRVRQYFAESGDGRHLVAYLRRNVSQVEFVLTANEKEAFLLENTLIKRHQPRYNIRLRDDKTYVSMRFAMAHDFPRLEVLRVRGRDRLTTPQASAASRRRDGTTHRPDRYFGPFDSAFSVRETIKFLLRAFPVRTCRDSVFRNRTRPCILFDVGKCCGPCTEPVRAGEYQKLVDGATAFLRGQDEEVRQTLVDRMTELAEREEYERAALVRDRLQAVERTLEGQRAASHDGLDRDLVAVASERGRSLVLLHEFRRGTLVHVREHYLRNHDQEDSAVLYAFLQQHYAGLGAMVPPEILLACPPDDMDLLQEVLASERRAGVEIRVPQRGEWLARAEQLRQNASLSLNRNLAGEHNQEETAEELQKRLGLDRAPRVIECVDISNIMGVMAVGALVRFENGEPDKSGWRLYKIRTVEGANDYAMMHEVLSRRFDPKSTTARPLPDFLLVDGGKGQLAVAEAVLKDLGLTERVAIGGIAKARVTVRSNSGKLSTRKASPAANTAHAAAARTEESDEARLRTEERVFLPGRKNPVTFPINSPALHLIVRIRDETHRSAITFHRNLRAKANRRSMLDEVPGVGPKRKKALLKAFGSLTAIRAATLEEIAGVPGVGASAAEAVLQFLKSDAGQYAVETSKTGEVAPSEMPDFEDDDSELAVEDGEEDSLGDDLESGELSPE
jgi:excinuclease ABC subunit C